MIIQNVGHDGTTDFSFTVNRGDFAKAMGILEGVKQTRRPRNHRRQQDLQGFGRRRRHAFAPGRRQPRCSRPWPMKDQHPDDLDLRIKISVVLDENTLELAVASCTGPFGLDQSKFDRREWTISSAPRSSGNGTAERSKALLLREHAGKTCIEGFESLRFRQEHRSKPVADWRIPCRAPCAAGFFRRFDRTISHDALPGSGSRPLTALYLARLAPASLLGSRCA